jgi:hypothetical protein
VEAPTRLRTAQDTADALVKKTRPRTSNNPKTIKATERRAQLRLVAEAKKTETMPPSGMHCTSEWARKRTQRSMHFRAPRMWTTNCGRTSRQ